MTMTSGVGTPFFMAPEMATGTKHYTGAVDVYSFAIMAAQVMVGKLVYDNTDVFETPFGLSFPSFHKQTNLFSLFAFFTTTNCVTPMNSIHECSVPRTSTSCIQMSRQSEGTHHFMLGCQPHFSSLFVFFSSCSHFLFHTGFHFFRPLNTSIRGDREGP